MITKLIAMFPDTYKLLVNSGVGGFGRRFIRDSRLAVTSSIEMAFGMKVLDSSITLSTVGDYVMMHKETKQELFSGYTSIRDHIVAAGNIKLYEMERKICDEKSI